MKICVAGAYGAFGNKHLEALDAIEGVSVTSVMGPSLSKIEALAKDRGIGHVSTSLQDCISRDDVDAVILATPTQMHAEQAIACMRAGKPVLIEIPMADSLADSEALVAKQKETGLVGMAGHVRRFNPSHQYVHNLITAGELNIQPMDMSIGMKTPNGAVCTLSLSFNNDGPLGTFFRYICDNGTYIARYDDLYDGRENQIDLSEVAVSNNGIELIDREFIAAIQEGRKPNGSVEEVLDAMRTLDKIERSFSQ